MTRAFRALPQAPKGQEDTPQVTPPVWVPVRRGLLGTLAALTATSVVPVAAADAELIAECAAAVEMKRASEAVTYPLTMSAAQAHPFDEEADRLLCLSDKHALRACAIPAMTRQGLIAKARMALAIVPRMPDGRPDLDWNANEAWAVVEDVLRLEALA